MMKVLELVKNSNKLLPSSNMPHQQKASGNLKSLLIEMNRHMSIR